MIPFTIWSTNCASAEAPIYAVKIETKIRLLYSVSAPSRLPITSIGMYTYHSSMLSFNTWASSRLSSTPPPKPMQNMPTYISSMKSAAPRRPTPRLISSVDVSSIIVVIGSTVLAIKKPTTKPYTPRTNFNHLLPKKQNTTPSARFSINSIIGNTCMSISPLLRFFSSF